MNFSITMHIEKRSRKVELKDLSNIIQRNISVVEQWMIKKVLTRECHIWTWLEFYRNPFDTPNICIFRWSTHSENHDELEEKLRWVILLSSVEAVSLEHTMVLPEKYAPEAFGTSLWLSKFNWCKSKYRTSTD